MAESDTQGAAELAGTTPVEPGKAPGIVAEVRADGTGYLAVDGVRQEVTGRDITDVGAQITARIAELADSVGEPLTAEVRDPEGMWMLLVHPDGHVDEAPQPTTAAALAAEVATPETGQPVAALAPTSSPATMPIASTDVPLPSRSLPARSAPAVGQPFSSPQTVAPPLTVARSLEDALADDHEPQYQPSLDLTALPAAELARAATEYVPPNDLARAASEFRPAAELARAIAEDPRLEPDFHEPDFHEPEYHDVEYPTVGYSAPAYPEPDYPPVHEPPAVDDPLDAEPESTLGDLLAPRRTRQPAEATWGVRAWVRRLTFGKISPRPGEKERRHLAATEMVRRPLDGPRTVVVINPKGGAHKTTTTLMLAATLGQQRGGYALAWDNNETHGTLGWRSATKSGGGTALDLLAALPELLALGDMRVGDLSPYVRSQGTEQFDVLASDEDATSGAFVDARAFNALHAMVTRFYRTIIIDTGNNIRSSNWRAAVEAADRLVIVTTVREDSAQAAAWAVDALRAAGLADLVRSAITIMSAPDRKVDKDLRERLRQHFGALTRTVVEVPYDPALVSGGSIDFTKLRRDTREAWLQAAASVVDGL
ncbi:MAG: chromosome partitioning protein [Micrococcales bacterium]|nr:chromosome partitioning protein [Micrococcales bacterium]